MTLMTERKPQYVINRNPLRCTLCVAPSDWWGYEQRCRRQKQYPVCGCSTCFQSWTLPSTDYSRMIHFHPLRSSGRAAWTTQLSDPVSSPPSCTGEDGSVWDVQTTGYSRRRENYRHHRTEMSAGCQDIRHVTSSSFPDLLRPATEHAWLSRLLVDDYRHLAYQQADTRANGGVALPVPVPSNHGNQYGDFLRQQVECRDAAIEKLYYSLEPTSTTPVCIPSTLHFTLHPGTVGVL